jgi:hypothetical protein
VKNRMLRRAYFRKGGGYKNFGVAWNKVYAKSFVEKHNLSFPLGYYEDIVWNAECIMRASAIYVIPDVLIYYRQRPGSILRSTDPRHFDTIARHREIVRILRSEPQLKKDFADALRVYSRNQMFATIHLGGRIPKGQEGRYLLEVSETLKMYDGLIGRRKSTIREKTARTGSYFLYRVYRYLEFKEAKIKAWRKEMPSIIDRRVHRSYKWLYRNVFMKLPIKNDRVIFDSFWGNKPDGNPLAIYASLRNRP